MHEHFGPVDFIILITMFVHEMNDVLVEEIFLALEIRLVEFDHKRVEFLITVIGYFQFGNLFVHFVVNHQSFRRNVVDLIFDLQVKLFLVSQVKLIHHLLDDHMVFDRFSDKLRLELIARATTESIRLLFEVIFEVQFVLFYKGIRENLVQQRLIIEIDVNMDEDFLIFHIFTDNMEEIIILRLAHKHKEIHIEQTPFLNDALNTFMDLLDLF